MADSRTGTGNVINEHLLPLGNKKMLKKENKQKSTRMVMGVCQRTNMGELPMAKGETI